MSDAVEIPILYQDANVVAVNKPPGLSVHEAPGPGGSLLREMQQRHGFSGLVPAHRLDKQVSGVLLLARTKKIAAQIQAEWASAEKTYIALCEGIPAAAAGVIDAPVLEHQTGKPERMHNAVRWFLSQHPKFKLPPLPAPKTSAVHPAGRPTRTAYRVTKTIQRHGRAWSWIEVRPQQGRMHQIRVHLKHLGCPLAADPLYGNRAELSARDLGECGDEILLTRVPLHAVSLTCRVLEKMITVEAPLLADLQRLADMLG